MCAPLVMQSCVILSCSDDAGHLTRWLNLRRFSELLMVVRIVSLARCTHTFPLGLLVSVNVGYTETILHSMMHGMPSRQSSQLGAAIIRHACRR